LGSVWSFQSRIFSYQVGDELLYLLFTSKPRSKDRRVEVRRVQIVQYVQRPVDSLKQLLQQMTEKTARGALPSLELTQIMTAKPLWRLLLEAAETESGDVEAIVRSLLKQVMCDGVARMRDNAKSLARDILGLPYFSATGKLASHLQDLVRER
jgi:hypothetical protein